MRCRPTHLSTPSFRISLHRWVVALVAVAVCTFAALPAAYAEARVVVVDLRRAMFDTEDGLRAQAELQQLQDSRQKQLIAKRDQYMKIKKQLETLAQAKKPNRAEVRKVAQQHDRALADLQVMDRTFKQELRDAEWKKTQPLRDKVIGLIRRVASQSGYDMVVLKEFAPYFRKDLDITDRIIQLYNQSLSAETAPKKKAPAAKRPRRKKN